MTVAELIEALKAMPQDALVVRECDEFSSLTDIGTQAKLVEAFKLTPGQWGDYAMREIDGEMRGDWEVVGPSFGVVLIG